MDISPRGGTGIRAALRTLFPQGIGGSNPPEGKFKLDFGLGFKTNFSADRLFLWG